MKPERRKQKEETDICFVLMPLSNEFSKQLKLAIKPAIERAGLRPHILDEPLSTSDLVKRVRQDIFEASLLIADISFRNANVMFELGLAHATGKRVIIITQERSPIPTVLRDQPYLIYDLENLQELRDKLTETILNISKKGSLKKAAVTCDIIGSSHYPKPLRKKVNELLYKGFDFISTELPQAKAEKLSFSVIKGDEFQFLLGAPQYAFDFIFYYRLFLSAEIPQGQPVFRAAIGIGDISVDNGNSDSYKMDGPAFYLSRDCYDYISVKSDRLTAIRTEEKSINDDLEVICINQDFFETNWTAKQREVIYLYHQLGKTKSEVANLLGIAYQNVQKRLKASHWHLFDNGMVYIRQKITESLPRL